MHKFVLELTTWMLLNNVLSISPPQAENFDVFGTFLDGFPLIFLQNRKSFGMRFFSDFTYLRIFGKSTLLRFHVPKDFRKYFELLFKKWCFLTPSTPEPPNVSSFWGSNSCELIFKKSGCLRQLFSDTFRTKISLCS